MVTSYRQKIIHPPLGREIARGSRGRGEGYDEASARSAVWPLSHSVFFVRMPRIAILRSFLFSPGAARPRHLLSFPPSFLLLPQSSRRSIHWSDIPPLRSREERCSVGVENRARARGAERNRPGGTWRRKRGRLFPFTDVPGEGRSAETGVSQPRSRVAWRRCEQDLYAIRMRKAAAAASAKSVCLPRHKRKWWH